MQFTSGPEAGLTNTGAKKRPACILVAEDQENLRNLLTLALSEQGYHVLAAKDGREAIDISQSFPGTVDVLLSDVVMPKVSGPELARQIREQRPKTAVILMSGYADVEIDEVSGLRPDFIFIEKPFILSQVISRVAAVLDERQGFNVSAGQPIASLRKT